MELLSGNIDASGLDQGFESFAQNPEFQLYHSPANTRITILWNHESPFFRNKTIRRALTLAINRRELARLSYVPDDVPLVDGPVSAKQYLEGNIPPAVPFDPVSAGDLLDEEGWTDTDGDGIRDQNGIDFRFTAFTERRSTRDAVYVQAQLKQVGIEMEIHTFDNGPILRTQMAKGEYDAAFQRTAWRTDVERLLDTAGPLHVGYSNPDLVRIIEEAENDWAPGWEERRNLKVWAIFQGDFPLTYLRL